MYNIPVLKKQSVSTKNGFKIYSENLINFINNFYKEIEDYINIEEKIAIENHHNDIIKYKYYKEFYNYIQYQFYTKINYKYGNGSFWGNLLGHNVCEYKNKNGKNEDVYCGRSIEIEPNHKHGNYRCSRHISKKYHTPISNNIVNKCKGINKHKKPCQRSMQKGEYCKYHYKEDIIEVNNKILFYKEYTNIELEINLFNNIEFISETNRSAMELLEIVGGNLNNSDSSRNYSFGENKNNEIREMGEINDNINIINIAKNAKYLENFNISNYISNTRDKLEKLNNKIIENTIIIENIKKNYTKIEYKKCEANKCNKFKEYNIIYNKYCKHHIHNRPKLSIPNCFHLYTPAAIDNQFMNQLQGPSTTK